MKKKILFLIQWYPSFCSANVNCDTNVMKELLRTNKYEIYCLSYRPKTRPLYEYIDGFHVYRFKRSYWWTKIQNLAERQEIKQHKLLFKFNRLLLRLRQLITIPIYPITEPLLCLHYYHEAKKLYEQEGFDIVISEHFGLDTLYAGYMLKKTFPEIKFMPIFWDSLSGGFCPKFLPEFYCRYKKRALEKRVMTVADKGIVMESSLQHHLTTTIRYDYYKKLQVLNIPYLYKRVEKSGKLKYPKTGLHFVYSGTLSQRDPAYILQLLSAIGDTKVTFICDVSYHQIINKYNFNGTLECLPYMQYTELINHLKSADVLFNIGVRESTAISGKIFDYMGYCKPIITTSFIDNEGTIPYIMDYPQGLVIDERLPIEINIEKLKNFLIGCSKSTFSFEEVAQKFSSALPSSYVKSIEEL